MREDIHNIDTIKDIISLILDENCTLRECAGYLGVSKSTVHTIIHNDIRKNFYSYYIKITNVLEKHFKEKHINGGRATHDKYEKIRREKWIF